MDINYLNYHRDREYLENEALFKNIFTKRFNIAKKFIIKPGTILDIGTSTGTMLDVFKEHDWKTWGVEPSESALIAKSKGHMIIHNYFEKTNLKENFFDLVILNHTLEHLDNPQKILGKVYRVLKTGGIILVDVPNFGGLSSKILKKHWPYLTPYEHRHQFTYENLTKILKNSGFKIIHWESRSGLFEYSKPYLELWRSLTTLKKRFIKDLLTLPFSLLATLLNMGDSMTFVGRKI